MELNGLNAFRVFMKYDVSCETVMLGLAIIVLLIMKIMQPKKTGMYKITQSGIVISILTIIAHLYCLYITCDLSSFTDFKFNVAYIIFSVFYITLIAEITTYVNLLSYNRRRKIRGMIITEFFLTLIYLSIALYPIVNHCAYIIDENGVIQLTKWGNLIELCGVICLFVNLINSFLIFKSVSKIVVLGFAVFIPMEIVIFIIQFKLQLVYFLSFTYVMPFVIFYCIFHGSKFDEIIGCQDIDSIQTMIGKAIKKNKKYVVITVKFPQMRKRRYSDLTKFIIVLKIIQRFVNSHKKH